MKSYHSIPLLNPKIDLGRKYYVFEKLDGSNMRAEWNPTKGFYKFGSRNILVDSSTPLGANAIPLMKAQEEAIGRVLKAKKIESAVCFFEFLGPHSFAGSHDYTKDSGQFECILIDINVHKKGILPPSQYLEWFSGIVKLPILFCEGLIDREDLEKLASITFEGIVAKADPEKRWETPPMFKFKNKSWIERVRSTISDPKILKDMIE